MRIERLLLRLVPAQWGESVAGDLDDARAKRLARGLRAGGLWGARYCGSIVGRLLLEECRYRVTTASRISVRILMTTLAFDCRQAVRALSASRGTTAVAIAILAMATGFSTAVFSVADGVLFKPLPYPAGERLVELRFTTPSIAGMSLTPSELASARAASNVLEQVEAFNLSGVMIRTDGIEAERLRVGRITPGLLPMLGAVVHGEGFSPADTAGKAAPVAIVTHQYWSARMGAEPSAVGKLLHFDGEPPLRVVGILGPGFVFPSPSLAVLPQILRPVPDEWLQRDGRMVRVIARLRPAVPAAAVETAVAVDARVRNQTGVRISATPLAERLAYSARSGLTLLFVGVLALLAVGVLDVAGLLVARATTREREIVTRRALGASTTRLARQLLMEALIIAAASGALGVAAARVAFAFLLHMVPAQLQLLRPAGIDARAVLFSAAVVALTTIVFGLAPMLHLGRVSASAVRSGGAHTASRRVRRLSTLLVTGQIAAALGLVLVGALLVSSFVRVRNADVGFDAGKLVFLSVSPPQSMLPTRGDFYRTALGRLRALEGVESAALLDVPPLRSTVRGTYLSPEGGTVPESTRLVSDTQLVVSTDYFATTGLHLLDGRLFTPDDEPNASGLAIVNERLARLWFPGQRAVGKRLVSPARISPVESRLIIGVVEDARHFSLKEEPLAEIFIPLNPAQPVFAGTFVVRSDDPDRTLDQSIAVIRALAPTVPITETDTGRSAIARGAAAERFYATLLSVSAATGASFAALGLYAMLSWSVASRRRELGLRAALGADNRMLASGIAREALPSVAWGAALGGLAGWWAARLASSLVYEVTPAAPEVWLATGAILLIVSVTAIALPCRRAFLTSPAEALRQET